MLPAFISISPLPGKHFDAKWPRKHQFILPACQDISEPEAAEGASAIDGDAYLCVILTTGAYQNF